MSARKPVLAGNWKMHKGPSEAREFFRAFIPELPTDGAGTVVFFPPAVSLAAAREGVGGHPGVKLGVQNVHWEKSGAFTGEVSAPLARDAGAEWVLVGHSERRHVFGETIEETVKKVRAVLEVGMTAVLCVGELLEERRAGRAEQVVAEQLEAVLETVSPGELQRLVIAYEPVWAIGTGETATPQDASTMHAAVRARLAERFGAAAAGEAVVLYGGSVKPENARELLAAPDVDGVLVGGASLDPKGFAAICARANASNLGSAQGRRSEGA
ncbi:MAG: triose-phosphate isomerase [Gemmatimonadota bacterium]|nr:triose-phosphate isomerase [Gemmatimonadota bacterium]